MLLIRANSQKHLERAVNYVRDRGFDYNRTATTEHIMRATVAELETTHQSVIVLEYEGAHDIYTRDWSLV